MKLSINKLIANDIINYGMDQASQIEDCNNANYNVSMDTYLDFFDDNAKEYILKNMDSIIEDIKSSECVLDLEVEVKDKKLNLDMIFAWEHLLNEVDKIVDYTAKSMGVEMDLKDIKEISNEVLGDDALFDDINSKIKSFANNNDKELDY